MGFGAGEHVAVSGTSSVAALLFVILPGILCREGASKVKAPLESHCFSLCGSLQATIRAQVANQDIRVLALCLRVLVVLHLIIGHYSGLI